MKRRKINTKRILFLVILLVFTISLSIFGLQRLTRRGFVKESLGSNTVIYIQEDGSLAHGEKEIDGNYYYFDKKSGARYTGFRKTKDGNVYYDKDGKRVSGLKEIDKKTYYFDKNGIMLANNFKSIEIDGKRQLSYFDQNGALVTNKKKLNARIKEEFDQLYKDLVAITENYTGVKEVYFKDLNTNITYNINPGIQLYPCCMVKPFVLAGVLDQIQKGKMDYEENQWYIENMITISDNTSYNRLLKTMGQGNPVQGANMINSLCQELGFNDTRLHHGLTPGEDDFKDGTNLKNTTSVADTAKFYEKLYQQKMINEKISNQMIELLKQCGDYAALKSGTPWATEFAHKSGCVDRLYHDGGIVYTDNADYILIVFSNEVNYVRQMMLDISNRVYNFEIEFWNQ